MEKPKFKNTIASLYPVDTEHKTPVVYYNVIKGHHLAKLYLKYILAAIDLNIKKLLIDIEVIRDDNVSVFNYNTSMLTNTFRNNIITTENDKLNTASFTSGPFEFEISDNETHFYSVIMKLKKSDGTLLDTSKTWLMTRPDK
ncbi:hypothetical protein [uncultured Limosilactobacillus sp.]|uniref:hypothetical protein n=1 Tax=uncultured Limosilactobacillus sp. TaxID=2837629 RepID=UPI002585EC2E|nr:hypothetical protein [uncultured Limosilactobacillus sp.]